MNSVHEIIEKIQNEWASEPKKSITISNDII